MQCKLCKHKQCDITHILFQCPQIHQERITYFKTLKHILKEETTLLNNITDKNKVIAILSLKTTENISKNINTIQATATFMQSIIEHFKINNKDKNRITYNNTKR